MSEEPTETIPERLRLILFPLSYRQVELPEDVNLKRELLRRYDKQWVLINDSGCNSKGSYLFVRVKIDKDDNRRYSIERPGEDGKLTTTELHYDDLEGLLVPGRAERIRHDFP